MRWEGGGGGCGMISQDAFIVTSNVPRPHAILPTMRRHYFGLADGYLKVYTKDNSLIPTENTVVCSYSSPSTEKKKTSFYAPSK